MRTVEQQRSKFALGCVEEALSVGGSYKSLVKKFPMMVLRNGLLQTIAFLESKGGEQHQMLLKHIKSYLRGCSPLRLELDDNENLSRYLSDIDVNLYRSITVDVLAFAKWLSRYAESLIEESGNE